MTAILNPNVSHTDCHTRVLGVASKSGLDKIARSPLHYREWCLSGGDEPTPAMRFGSLAHRFLLEPEKAASMVQLPDFGDGRTTAAREAKRAFLAEHDGAEFVSADDWTTLRGMQLAIDSHDVAKKLIVNGIAEASIFWTDAESGIECKARPDYWIESLGLLVDLKTTEDASPGEFAKSVANYRYHVQHAFYLDGMVSLGKQVNGFVFIAVEKKPPYAVGVYQLDAASVGKGRELYRRDMATLAQCLFADDWPAFGNQVMELSLPLWAMR